MTNLIQVQDLAKWYGTRGKGVMAIDEIVYRLLPFVPEDQDRRKTLEFEFMDEQLALVEAMIEKRRDHNERHYPADELPAGERELFEMYLQKEVLLKALRSEVENRPLVLALRERVTFADKHMQDADVRQADRTRRLERWRYRVEQQFLLDLLADWESWLETHNQIQEGVRNV